MSTAKHKKKKKTSNKFKTVCKQSNRCVAINKNGKRCKRCRWDFGDSTMRKQHEQQKFRASDKFSIINYRYTNPSKYAVEGLGATEDSAIFL